MRYRTNYSRFAAASLVAIGLALSGCGGGGDGGQTEALEALEAENAELRREADEARTAQEAAEARAAEAEATRTMAEQARAAAEEAQRRAEQARDAAEVAQRVAEQARDAAEVAQRVAEQARDAAEVAQRVAEQARAEAEAAKALSDKERMAAEARATRAEADAAAAMKRADAAKTAQMTAEQDRDAAQTALDDKLRELGEVDPPRLLNLCQGTQEDGCVTGAEYHDMADALAEPYADTSSFRNQWGLGAIRADRAYANLELFYGPDVAPGEGVTVGVLDTGIDAAHHQFRNKDIRQLFLPGGTGDDGSEFSHGTAVAGLIAGEDSPALSHDAHGVAWGADLVVFSLPLGTAPELYRPTAIDQLPGRSAFLSTYLGAVLDWESRGKGVDFINASLGTSGNIENYSEEVIREHVSEGLAVLAQEGEEEKVVIIWSAGNSNGRRCEPTFPQCVGGAVVASSPELYAGLMIRAPEIQGHSVAVVAVNPEGEIADFSNRCGIAADHCIAAPGEGIRVAYFGPDNDGEPGARGTYGNRRGTSFAAPMVTGGLALMKQYFRGQLSNPDLLGRLLETADRTGNYADAQTFGRGMMDLGAATSPVGMATVALGDRVHDLGAAIDTTSLRLGTAFGDGLSRALAEQEIAAFDALGAPFWYELGGFASVPGGPSLSARLQDFQRMRAFDSEGSLAGAMQYPLFGQSAGSPAATIPLILAMRGSSSVERAGHLALAGRSLSATLPVGADLQATAITTEGVSGQKPTSGAALSWRAPDTLLGLRGGWIGERQTLLGSEPDGAFGSLAANAAFAGMVAGGTVGSWRLGAAAEIGSVSATPADGLFQDISALTTSAFAVHATRMDDDGRALRVSVSQPLRIEHGTAALSVPSGRSKAGEVIWRPVHAGLEPSGRQVDVAFQWQEPMALGAIRVGATLSREPSHVRGASPDVALLANWHLAF